MCKDNNFVAGFEVCAKLIQFSIKIIIIRIKNILKLTYASQIILKIPDATKIFAKCSKFFFKLLQNFQRL